MGVTSDYRQQLRAAMQDSMEDLGHEIIAGAAENAPPSPPPDEDPNEAVSIRESGYVEPRPGGGVEVGFRTPYVVKLHEALHYDHPRGGGPKFLENEVAAVASQLEGRLAVEMRTRMARGSGHTRRY